MRQVRRWRSFRCSCKGQAGVGHTVSEGEADNYYGTVIRTPTTIVHVTLRYGTRPRPRPCPWRAPLDLALSDSRLRELDRETPHTLTVATATAATFVDAIWVQIHCCPVAPSRSPYSDISVQYLLPFADKLSRRSQSSLSFRDPESTSEHILGQQFWFGFSS